MNLNDLQLSMASAPVGSLEINERDFRRLSKLVYDTFGINLEGKQTLLATRLSRVIRERGLKTFHDYYEYVVQDLSGKTLNELATLISTNHTYFYREKEHFDYFTQTVLPDVTGRLARTHSRDLRIWSSGCSSGEEPYMLVMLMMEYFGEQYKLWDAGVLATDISERALTKAMKGVYPLNEFDATPSTILNTYFRKVDANTYKVIDRVRKEVTIRRFNLIQASFPFKQSFHVIFCRNVMIYFDRPTIEGLLRRFHQHTAPGGYLFIGQTESLSRDQKLYEYIMPGVYRKPE